MQIFSQSDGVDEQALTEDFFVFISREFKGVLLLQ